MSQTSHEPQQTSSSTSSSEATSRTTSSSKDASFDALRTPLPTPERAPSPAMQGWAYFGAAVMALMGMFWAVLGLVALADDQYFTVRTNRLLALDTYTAWGWVHLLGGLLAVAAGIGILWGGHRLARIAGIVVAGLSAIVNLGFLAAAPVWSITVIALDVLVIYALTVHGWEIDER